MLNAESSLRPSLQHSSLSIQHFLLLFLALCPYFIGLADSSIWDANEAFYVETPREMMERGDYINPTFNYEPRINKPVLSYWIVAGFYHLFGVSPAVQRIPIAIGGMVLDATAFLLARAASPEGRTAAALVGGDWSGRVAASFDVLASHLHRHLHLDVHGADAALLCAGGAISSSAASVSRADVRERRAGHADERADRGASAGSGLCDLPRRAPRVGTCARHAHSARTRSSCWRSSFPGTRRSISSAGWAPIKSFFFGENLARYVEGVGVNADRPFWWYLPVVFSDSFPWSIFLFPAAALWFRDAPARMHGSAACPHPDAALDLDSCDRWFLLTLGGKQDLYIYPIVPAIVALAGIVIDRAPIPPPRTGRVSAWSPRVISGSADLCRRWIPDAIQ